MDHPPMLHALDTAVAGAETTQVITTMIVEEISFTDQLAWSTAPRCPNVRRGLVATATSSGAYRADTGADRTGIRAIFLSYRCPTVLR